MELERLQSHERSEQCAALAMGAQSKMGGGKSMYSNKLTVSVSDYRDVAIPPGSVIYVDCPYIGTRGYGADESFDHEALYDWCEQQSELVVISEYWMPEDRFICIAQKERVSTYSATNNGLKKIEKLFVPKRQLELYKTMMSKDIKQKSLFDL